MARVEDATGGVSLATGGGEISVVSAPEPEGEEAPQQAQREKAGG